MNERDRSRSRGNQYRESFKIVVSNKIRGFVDSLQIDNSCIENDSIMATVERDTIGVDLLERIERPGASRILAQHFPREGNGRSPQPSE